MHLDEIKVLFSGFGDDDDENNDDGVNTLIDGLCVHDGFVLLLLVYSVSCVKF